ncbi:MAG: TonB-dependent receptor plug domain-containing protein, partial [Bacteroidota bacterium]
SIPPGNYTLFCTYVGYDTFQLQLNVKASDLITQNISLNKVNINLSGVTITAKSEEKRTETTISVTKITAKDINKIPGIGGEPDLAQFLQVIPGVIFTGDQGGELYMRGGTPIQTKILLDGMTIYNPFHSIGLFSVFETDAIKNVSVLNGAFNAENGGRLSAVVDVQTRDGNRKHLAGKLSVNPFQSKLLLEGPFKKISNENNSSISYLFTAKSSYLDRTSKLLYNYVDSLGLPFNYTDLYGKISINGDNGSKLTFFGYHFNDNANYFSSRSGWKSFGAGTNFVVVPGQSNALINGSFSLSDYRMSLQEADTKPRTSGINGFDLITDITYFLQDAQLKYGINIGGYRTTLEFVNSIGNRIDQNQNTTEISAFFVFKKNTKRIVLEPSFRLHYYASLPAFSPEPRIAIKYNASDDLRIKFASGIYSQNFISTKADLDIVNLFTGFLTAPDGQLQRTDGSLSNNNLQRAYHIVMGFEKDVAKNIEINIEPYYKYFQQLINLNRNKIAPRDPDFQIETGQAYGIDFLLKYDYKNFYLWTGYSLSYVYRDNGDQVYFPHYDRRHNANIVSSYSWGKLKKWQADIRWNLGSGFPFTLTQGFYDYQTFSQGLYSNPYTTNGQLGIVYNDQLNTGRLPYYHRLDLSVKRTFYISERTKIESYVSIVNVYNRRNIFYFDRVRYSRVDQLPIIPAAGLSFSF